MAAASKLLDAAKKNNKSNKTKSGKSGSSATGTTLPPIKPIEGKEPAQVLSEMEQFRQLLERKGLESKDYDLLKTYYGNIKDARDAVKTKNSWQLDDLIYQIEKDIRQAQMDDILWREEQDALVYEDMEKNKFDMEDYLKNRGAMNSLEDYMMYNSDFNYYMYGIL